MTRHLWINAIDLMLPALHGPFGTMLNLFVNEELGDQRLPGAVYNPKSAVDQLFIVVECQNDARPEAIRDALELIGKEKIGRKIRTRITAGHPTSPWKWRSGTKDAT